MKKFFIYFLSLSIMFTYSNFTSIKAEELYLEENSPKLTQTDYYEDSEKTITTYTLTDLNKEDETIIKTENANGNIRYEIYSASKGLVNVVTTENNITTITENGFVIDTIKSEEEEHVPSSGTGDISTYSWVLTPFVTYYGSNKIAKMTVAAIALTISAIAPGGKLAYATGMASIIYGTGIDTVWHKKSQRTRTNYSLRQQYTFGSIFFYSSSSRSYDSLLGGRDFENLRFI